MLPGGHIEGDEATYEAAIREVGEESGWKIANLKPLAVLHYHQLRPASDGRLLSDFLQAVFLADAGSFQPELRESEGHEISSEFLPADELLLSQLAIRERLLIRTVLDRRAPGN